VKSKDKSTKQAHHEAILTDSVLSDDLKLEVREPYNVKNPKQLGFLNPSHLY